jgi:hypothetical protein
MLRLSDISDSITVLCARERPAGQHAGGPYRPGDAVAGGAAPALALRPECRPAWVVKGRGRGDNDKALTLGQVAASARRKPDQRGDQDRDEKHHHDDGGRDRAVPAVLLVHVSPSCG